MNTPQPLTRSSSSAPLIDWISKSKSPDSSLFSIPHTPYEEDFQVLVKGNLPIQILESLSAFFLKTSEGVKVEVEEVFLSQNLEERKHTASQPLVIKVDNQKVAIFKPRQREPGSKAWLSRYPDTMVPKYFCTSGTGAFMELVCSMFIDHSIQMLPEIQSHVIIPKVAYVQMGHPSFYLHAKTEDFTSPIFAESPKYGKVFPLAHPVRGTGSLHEFIQNCRTCSMVDFLQKPLVVQEFIAIMHMLLLDSDAHIGNILISQDQKLVMIDHSYTLSVDGLEGGQFFWIHNAEFKNPISSDMQNFIRNLDENFLSTLVDSLQNEFLQSFKGFGDEFFVECIGIQENRIIGHQIVSQFLKLGISKGLTIFDFAASLVQRNPARHEGLVFDFFQSFPTRTSDDKTLISQFCEMKILDLLQKKQ